MDPNQCGGSNPMKDFSRLTLEDRSRQQDLRGAPRTSRGGHQGSFRSRGVNGPQLPYDGFEGAGNNLAPLPTLDASRPSFQPLGMNAQGLGAGHHFGQPVPSAGGFQQNAQSTSAQPRVQPSLGNPGPGEFGRPGALTHEQRFPEFGPPAIHPQPLAQNPAQANRFPGFGAHDPAAGRAFGVGRGMYPQAGPQFHPGGLPMANFPVFPRHVLQPDMQRDYTDATAFAQTNGQAQRAAALQQQQFDREFQDAMDEWMSQHGDVADRKKQARSQREPQAARRAQATPSSQREEMELASQAANFAAMTPEEQFEANFRPAEGSIGDEITKALSADNHPTAASTVSSDSAPQTQEDRSKLALAAQNVIDAVADNDSTKFKNSKFLQMMRGLAEEQIVLEGRDFVRREQPATSPSAMVGRSGSHVTGSSSGAQQQQVS
ncbi:hypothetical protein SLS62_009866 [Diatrype stigma]|uniref:Peroxin 20 n=1 Tax=Diatrype stigma TaxID=117547 RepID=A0AAN9UCF7_9PEZI